MVQPACPDGRLAGPTDEEKRKTGQLNANRSYYERYRYTRYSTPENVHVFLFVFLFVRSPVFVFKSGYFYHTANEYVCLYFLR